MRPGDAVRIRVNPRDMVSTVDALRALGVQVPGMSFPQAVSIAYSALLEYARQAGIIPDRDRDDTSAQWAENMQPFDIGLRTAKKLAVTRAQAFNSSRPRIAVDPAKARIQRRMEELAAKRDADETNFTEAELSEFQDCLAMLAGDIPLDVSKLRA